MPLSLHLSPRADLLADELAGLLATPLDDPFTQELVVVQGKGVERWLTQRLAHRLGTGGARPDGVCAGIRFVAPHTFSALLLGSDHDDPWRPDAMVWPLLETIDTSLGDPAFSLLATHLGHRGDDRAAHDRQARRFAVARRVADLFSAYGQQRPQLLTDWRQGNDTDGAGGVLPDDLRWQAELWRRLLPRVDAPAPDVRLQETLERLAAGTLPAGVPTRLSWFGRSPLRASDVALLKAVAEHTEVHLWLPEVSTAVWDSLVDSAQEGVVARADDASARQVSHPLLASLGRETRELRRSLGAVSPAPAPPLPPRPDSLLGWLQTDLGADTVQAHPRPLDAADRSVQVHACHGPARQVEVLREVLVGLMEDDPTLEPRDVLVLCPDLDSYAPLFSASFGLAEVAEGAHPGHDLRVRLAHHSPASANPLLAFAVTMLDLARSRVTATQVVDLASSSPVRTRFGFSEEDLERIARWVHDSGVRWGLDHGHRASYGVPLVHNTWLIGMRRVLLGAAVSGLDDRIVASTLALDDVGDGDLDLLGRFTEFLDRVIAFVEQASSARTVTDWTTALTSVVSGLTLCLGDDAWQRAQFDREIERVHAGPGAAGTPMRAADVRSLLNRRLQGRAGRSTFRTGALTVTTMAPLRAVPHRVVALVGLDDGSFPRKARLDGDDVLARGPRTGERDPGAEDRQLLLDALASAGDHLVVTHSGRGEHSGLPKPASVPLGELLDALDVTASRPDGSPARTQVLVQHPLQPFDEKNLVPGELGTPHAFTFDAQALAGAQAARAPREAQRALLPVPLGAPAPAPGQVPDAKPVVTLTELHDFFKHPAKAFLSQRLRVSLPRVEETGDDGVPLDLDTLQKWAIGENLVRARMRGVAPGDAGFVERLRGVLPPNQLGISLMNGIGQTVDALVEGVERIPRGTPRTIDVDVDLGDVRVIGTVPEVFGNHRITVTYSSLAAKHRLAGWIDALALAAGHPDENWTVHSIGRQPSARRGNGGTEACIAPLPENEARAWLRRLVGVRALGLREPLPLPLKTSLKWAEEHAMLLAGREVDPDQRARNEWRTQPGPWSFPREDADPAHVRVWGRDTAYETLAAPLRADEDQLHPTITHRLGTYAWAVWGPLLSDDLEKVKPL